MKHIALAIMTFIVTTGFLGCDPTDSTATGAGTCNFRVEATQTIEGNTFSCTSVPVESPQGDGATTERNGCSFESEAAGRCSPY